MKRMPEKSQEDNPVVDVETIEELCNLRAGLTDSQKDTKEIRRIGMAKKQSY